MHSDFDNEEAEAVEYPPSDREIRKITPSHPPPKPNTIMKPTISQSNKAIRPTKPLKENLSKPKENPPQVHISLKKYVKTSPQANKTLSFTPSYPSLYVQQSQPPSNYPKPPLDPQSDPQLMYREYYTLYQTNAKLMAKCEKLEEILRTETIHSEEQRSYIEILRQALEEKVISAELWGEVKIPSNSGSQADFYLEIMKLKAVIDQKERETGELLQSLEESKRNYESVIQRTNELESAEAKLIEEKESLLEYLDELKENFMRIEQQNTQYESLIASLKREKDELKAYLEDLKPQIEEKIEENAKLFEELQSEKALAQEIESHRQKLLERNEEIELELRNLEVLKGENRGLKAEVESLSQEKLTLAEKLRLANENFSTLKCTLQETQADLDKSTEKSSFMVEEIRRSKELIARNQEIEGKYKALREEFEALEQSKNSETARLEQDRQRKIEELKSSYQQISQSRSEIRSLKEELSKLEAEKAGFLLEIDSLAQQSQLQKTLASNLESEVQEYKKILQERDLSSAKLHTLSIKYQADKDFYEDSMKELRRKNNELLQENEGLMREFQQKESRQSLESIEKRSQKTTVFSSEQAFKYVNSMIIDLKRHLGNTKLTRNSEKFDLESCLLELHELIIMCLERFEEISQTSLSKRQYLEEKDLEIRALQERIEAYEQGFERNIELFEKEKAHLAVEHQQRFSDLKRQEEVRVRSLEGEFRAEAEQLKENCNKLRLEKQCFEYLLKRFKGSLGDEETKRAFDDLVILSFEILELEIKKTELQVKLDQTTKQNLKDSYYDLATLKENLCEIQRTLERFYDKKRGLEADMQKIELIDRKRPEDKAKRMIKTNSESNLRAIFEETRGTENSLISQKNFESKLSSIKDEKAANKPQIYRDFSSSKYVSYQDKFEKAGSFYERSSNLETSGVSNNLNELRNKLAKKGWMAGGMGHHEEKI